MYNMVRFVFVVALAACGMVGCMSAWSESQCKHTDWYALGKRNGAAGVVFDISQVQQQCMEDYHVAINKLRYEQGYEDGLSHDFCTSRHAYELGKTGYNYQGTCRQVGKDSIFREGWVRGLRLWCIPININMEGRHGNQFPGWCDNIHDISILTLKNAYDKGYNVFNQKRQIASDINEVNGQISRIDAQISDLKRPKNITNPSSQHANSIKLIALERERNRLIARRQDLELKKYSNPR